MNDYKSDITNIINDCLNKLGSEMGRIVNGSFKWNITLKSRIKLPTFNDETLTLPVLEWLYLFFNSIQYIDENYFNKLIFDFTGVDINVENIGAIDVFSDGKTFNIINKKSESISLNNLLKIKINKNGIYLINVKLIDSSAKLTPHQNMIVIQKKDNEFQVCLFDPNGWSERVSNNVSYENISINFIKEITNILKRNNEQKEEINVFFIEPKDTNVVLGLNNIISKTVNGAGICYLLCHLWLYGFLVVYKKYKDIPLNQWVIYIDSCITNYLSQTGKEIDSVNFIINFMYKLCETKIFEMWTNYNLTSLDKKRLSSFSTLLREKNKTKFDKERNFIMYETYSKNTNNLLYLFYRMIYRSYNDETISKTLRNEDVESDEDDESEHFDEGDESEDDNQIEYLRKLKKRKHVSQLKGKDNYRTKKDGDECDSDDDCLSGICESYEDKNICIGRDEIDDDYMF